MNWDRYKEKALKNSQVFAEYKKLEPEYEIIKQIIQARIEQNMSQKELAQKVGTQQSNISRLESGEYNPSLQFLKKVANSLGKELHISFI